MTIKTRTELEAAFADNEELNITPKDVRDLIASLGVGGVLYGSGDQAITTSAEAFTAFTGSKSYGVACDETLGNLTVPQGGDGFYQVVFVATLTIPANGQIQMRMRKNGSNTPFKTGALDIEASANRQVIVLGSGELVAGDVIDVTIQGSGNATATVESCQFQIDR